MSNTAIALPLAQHYELVQAAVQNSRASNTRRAYASDWNVYERWCLKNKLVPLPATPETICLYLSEMAPKRKVSTMHRALAAIRSQHQAWSRKTLSEEQIKNFLPPTADEAVRIVMQGFRRQKGVAKAKKAPLLAADLRRIFMTMDDPGHPLAVRDRALLLIAFSGAMRRSELAAMHYEHLRFTDEGMAITIPRSKTDQEGAGCEVGIWRGGALCPVRALEAWLKLAGITTGGVWRVVHWSGKIPTTRMWKGRLVKDPTLCDEMISQTVKRYAGRIGKNPAEYGAHSTRRGFATAATHAGASAQSIMKTTRHKSLQSVQEYIDEGALFANNASALLGL